MTVFQDSFRERYRRLSDAELLDLVEQGQTQYTELAWTNLHEEIARRGLTSARPKTEVKILPVRGLGFLAYIAPWGLIVQGIGETANKPGGTVNELLVSLALSLAMAIPLWYGVSRRRVWGWWLVLAYLGCTPIVGAFEASMQMVVGGMIALIGWGIYLAKRRHLFYPASRMPEPSEG